MRTSPGIQGWVKTQPMLYMITEWKKNYIIISINTEKEINNIQYPYIFKYPPQSKSRKNLTKYNNEKTANKFWKYWTSVYKNKLQPLIHIYKT